MLITPKMLYNADVSKLEGWIEDLFDCEGYTCVINLIIIDRIQKEIELRRVWAE